MTDCRGIKLLAGNSNPELAKKIAQNLGNKLGKTTVSKFSNGESNGNNFDKTMILEFL